jgi:hypothetical protein
VIAMKTDSCKACNQLRNLDRHGKVDKHSHAGKRCDGSGQTPKGLHK